VSAAARREELQLLQREAVGDLLLKQENVLAVPAAFSPLQ